MKTYTVWANLCTVCGTTNPAPEGEKVKSCSGCGSEIKPIEAPSYEYSVWTPGAELRPRRRHWSKRRMR